MSEDGVKVSERERGDEGVVLSVTADGLFEDKVGDHVDVTLENQTRLVWEQLKYTVCHKSWRKWTSVSKTILHQQSGSLRPGHLTAVIGPSGAGKSTLLECLSGRRRLNLSGDIYFKSPSGVSHKLRQETTVSFMGQKDHHIDSLTVLEALVYASRLKNYRQAQGFNQRNRRLLGDDYHIIIVDNVMKELNLDSCANTLAKKCSGGQLKRLSFALELVSKPNFLLLDEPMSGLDSSAAYHCMRLLKNLTLPREAPNSLANRLGIMVSVHQPSAKILSIFDNLYIISNEGQCIYNGPQQDLLTTLAECGLKCPPFHNPSDYVIEIASGDYGEGSLKQLVDRQQQTWAEVNLSEIHTVREPVTVVVDRMTAQPFPVGMHCFLLLLRTWKQTIREPLLTWLRLLQHVSIAVVVALMYNHYVGEPDGCFAEIQGAYESKAPDEGVFFRNKAVTSENASMLFFAILFLVYANTMSSVLTFPLQFAVFLKERGNGWYGSGAYYLATMVADLPFQIVIPLVFSCIAYPATGQHPDMWRFLVYSLVNILTAVISQSVGVLFGILFVENMSAAVFMAPISLSPLFLMGGLFVSYNGLTLIMKPLAIISYIRYAFESLIVIVYGFDRCSESFNGPSRDEGQASYMLSHWDLNDSDLWVNLSVLVFFVFFIRIAAYLLLLYKVSKKR